MPQEEKNRPGGGAHRDDQYNDRYSHNQQQPYGQQNTAQSQTALAGNAGSNVDPYAPYGGYEAYFALWYKSLQASQGQQQAPQDQGPPGEQRPPGS